MPKAPKPSADRWIRFASAAMLIVSTGLLGATGYLFIMHGYQPNPAFTPIDLITIVLAAVAIILTALGIFIAALAIWGYARLAEDARSRAERVATQHVGDVVPILVARAMAAQVGTTGDFGDAAAKGGTDAGSKNNDNQ